MAYKIVDIDGTLALDNNEANKPLITYLNAEVMEGDTQVIVVSARPIERLEETRAWLQENGVAGVEAVYLNDFEGAGQGPNVGLAFKRAKYEALITEYGIMGEATPNGIECAIDNDPEVIAMAKELGLEAKTPTEYLQDDTQPENVTEDTAAAEESPAPTTAVEPGTPYRGSAKDIETRNLGLGEFRLTEKDGQKVFTGYAALYGAPSAGLPFTETIKPGAFKRTLGRVAKAERVVKFLHGHDESRMLASTASGRLTLTEDSQGLRVEAKLDPADPDAAAVISKLTHEAKAMGMSFGFTVPKGGDTWEGESRTLNEVNLFEVSILSGHQPAYPATLGLSAVRKVAEARIGVNAERLISTLETVKAGKSLSPDEVEVIDAVRMALAPKPVEINRTIAAARLVLAELETESI
jgi:HK97 family phage prohead protease